MSTIQFDKKKKPSLNKRAYTNITKKKKKKSEKKRLQGREMLEHILPIDGEQLKWSRLVADRASPCGLLLIHLQEENSVETLKMGAG